MRNVEKVSLWDNNKNIKIMEIFYETPDERKLVLEDIKQKFGFMPINNDERIKMKTKYGFMSDKSYERFNE